jgi:drug/metabolite transporter (DMT)-like permease
MTLTTTAPETGPGVAGAPKPRLWFAPALLSLSALSWAGNHVVARSIAGEVPPATLNVLRWLAVALLVGVFAQASIRRDWTLMRRHWLILAMLGVSGGGIFGTLQYVGLQYTTVINMGVLNSVAPAMLALAGFLAFRDALRPVQVLGILVSLTGVIAIASRSAAWSSTAAISSSSPIWRCLRAIQPFCAVAHRSPSAASCSHSPWRPVSSTCPGRFMSTSAGMSLWPR